MVRKLKSKKYGFEQIKLDELIKENLDYRKELENLIEEIEFYDKEIQEKDIQITELNIALKEAQDLNKDLLYNQTRNVRTSLEKRLKSILEENPNLSVTELAKRVGVTRQNIYKTYRHLIITDEG